MLARYKRSPFLLTHWNEDNKIVVWNYNLYSKILVSKDLVEILNMLSEWTSAEEIADKLGLDKKYITKTLENLVKLKIIHVNRLPKEEMMLTHMSLWDPIDLSMQRQRSYGGRLPFEKRVGKSPSPIKHMTGLSSVTLPKPQSSMQQVSNLTDVLDDRISIRNYDNAYLTLTNLSHFLYYSARIKEIFKSQEGTLTKRPYPSGGARYPLEIYVANNRIRDIQKGIYYYDPLKHQLILLNTNRNYARKFNRFIKNVLSPMKVREPDVTLIITAVFARTMWKYGKLGLSLIMTDLGCLYQTMYLIATQMKLAPCPLGKTEEDLVKNWLQLNWFHESHVGTFMLGVPEQL